MRSGLREEHVEPQVVLVAVQQVRPVQVALHDVGLVRRDVVQATRQPDACALAALGRLDDERLVAVALTVLPLLFELGVVGGQHESLREHLVLLADRLEHLVQVARRARLPHQLEHAGEVVDLLHTTHFHDLVHADRRVSPAQVASAAPGVALPVCFPAQQLGRVPHGVVLGEHQSLHLPKALQAG